MKKILLGAMTAICLVMSASCSKESAAPEKITGPVTVSATVPLTMTKSVPTAPENHQLRCILVVDYPDGTADERFEQIAAGTENFSFTFTPQATGYTCLFWADYTDAGADASEDKYYNTSDLHNIVYADGVLTDGSLFNNDACDAFSGSLAEGKTAVTLYRPFAKLTFRNSAGAISATSLDVTYKAVPSGFDVLTNTTSSTATVSVTGASPADASGTWFYNYIFAPVSGQNLPGDITLSVDDGEEKTISAADVPLDANHDTGISFALGEETTITVDIEDELDVERPVDPKVGDFFYTDGTWSTTMDDNKTVAGVIFALADGAASGDDVANYPEAGLTEIKGWVIAAADAGTGIAFKSGEGAAIASIPEGMVTDATDIRGFANTSAWLAETDAASYLAASTAQAYSVEITGTTSGWYLPSVGQLNALAGVYATNNDGAQGEALAVKTALQTLADASKGSLMSSTYYWSSTGGITGGNNGVYRFGFHESSNYSVAGVNTNVTSGSAVRAVLTF